MSKPKLWSASSWMDEVDEVDEKGGAWMKVMMGLESLDCCWGLGFDFCPSFAFLACISACALRASSMLSCHLVNL